MKTTCLLTILALTASAFADVRLPAHFSDHVVLQRDKPLPVWGWAEFARLIQPLIERDHYGKVPAAPITPPNLVRAKFTTAAKDAIALEFDQPIVWTDARTGQFYLDGEKDKVASGALSGNVLTLKLSAATTATKLTYLKESAWSQDKLVRGTNGIAALTFCDVALSQ